MSHFWQRLWRHRCADNPDASFLLWSAYQQWWRNLFQSEMHKRTSKKLLKNFFKGFTLIMVQYWWL